MEVFIKEMQNIIYQITLEGKTLLKFLGFFNMIVLSVSMAGAEYYVDINSLGGTADDNNPGTLKRPWKTLTRAVNKAYGTPKAGDTVYVRGGVYPGKVRMTKSGNPGHPLRIKGFKNEKAIFDGDGKTGGFVITGASNLLLEKLTLRNFKKPQSVRDYSNSNGVMLVNTKNITIDKLNISGCRIGLWATRSDNLTVSNSIISNAHDGIYVGSYGKKITITGNRVSRCRDNGRRRGFGIIIYGGVTYTVGTAEVKDIKMVSPKTAILKCDNILDKAKGKCGFDKMRNGNLIANEGKGKLTPSLVLLCKGSDCLKWRKNTKWGVSPIAGGTYKNSDGRQWFTLVNVPKWNNKPYSPDGKSLIIDVGNATVEDLKKVRFCQVACTSDPNSSVKDVIVTGNEVYDCDFQGIWVQSGDGLLIKNNRIHHCGASGIQIESRSRNIWIENNRVWENNYFYHYETGIWVHETVNAVIQNNYVAGNQTGIAATQICNTLWRFNLVVNNNSQNVVPAERLKLYKNTRILYIASANGYKLNAPLTSSNNAIIHNTFYSNGRPETIKSGGIMLGHPERPEQPLGRTYMLNNIMQKTMGKVILAYNNAPDCVVDGNIYQPEPHSSIRLNNGLLCPFDNTGFNIYRRKTGKDLQSQLKNVVFVSPKCGNYQPSRKSLSIVKKTVPIAHAVSAGSGKIVKVDNVSCLSDGLYFSDGSRIVQGDNILIGDKEAVIMKRDCNNNTITIDRKLSWIKNAPVHYAVFGRPAIAGAIQSKNFK